MATESPLLIRAFHQNSEILSSLFDKNLVRIGRASDCELQIPDPTISKIQCTLRRKEGVWYFEDSSRNGMLLPTGEPVAQKLKVERLLRFKLGRLYELELDPSPRSSSPSVEKTLLLTQQPTQLLHLSEGKVVLGKAYLRYHDVAGQERTFPLSPQGASIGSHPSNDIVLDSGLVSQFHARIEFQQNQFNLIDLNSTNGSFVAGIRISKAPLTGTQTIRFGEVEVGFALESKEHTIAPKSETTFMGMVSQDEGMRKVFSLCEVVAATDAPVFIQGETGAGKELLAKAVHDLSPRYDRPFIALNCAALPHELVESELFGHEKGAFTGAMTQRIGAFEAAHGGTLFLDEIAELDSQVQAKILRALESGEIKRVGSNRSIQVSVRIVSATHKDLLTEVQNNRFREDLYFRLHVVPVQLPPLRDRLEDLALLVPHLLEKLNSKLRLDTEALEALKRHGFPGNIRELRNILQRAAVEYEANLAARKEKYILNLNHFRFLEDLKNFRPAKSQAEISEREAMVKALEQAHFNQSEAARRLGIPISTFHDRMKRYGLERERLMIPRTGT